MDWSGSSIRFVPWAIGASILVWSAEAAAERVVYINLGGVTINSDNGQDPATDSFSVGSGFTPGTVTGFPLTAAEQNLLEFYLKEATVPFDLSFVFERPATGEYDMVVFGTDTDFAERFPDSGGCSTSLSLGDCGDSSGHNISFMFYGCLPDDQQSEMRRIAFHALTALGFGWGLENESVNGQIMGSYNQFNVEFGDSCVDLVNQGEGACPAHPGCPAGQQNATEDLDAIIGPRQNNGPPAVSITSPADGATVSDNFDVLADVSDDFGGLEVTLSLTVGGETMSDEDTEPPYAWNLAGLPAGTYTVDVEVVDADEGMAASSITVTVEGQSGDDGGPSTTGDDTGEDSSSPTTEGAGDTGSSTDPSDSGDPSDPTIDPTAASGTGDASGSGGAIDPTSPVSPEAFGAGGTGCQCNTTRGSDNWGALGSMFLLGLGVIGRRRNEQRSTRPSRTSQRRDRTSRSAWCPRG